MYEDLLNLDLTKLKVEAPVGENSVPETKILTEKDLFLSELDSSFWLDGKYPTNSELENKFGGQYQEWLDDELDAALVARGLPKFRRSNEDNIDPHFVLACNLVCDYNDKRTLAAKLKEVGLNTKKWNALLRVHKNQQYFKTRVEQTFTGVETEAKIGLTKAVATGDLNAIKYFNEMTGVYRPGQENTDLLRVILVILMEILAKHIEGPKLIEIADAMEQHPQLKELMK